MGFMQGKLFALIFSEAMEKSALIMMFRFHAREKHR